MSGTIDDPRPAQPDEIQEAVALSNLMFRKDREPNMGRFYPLIFSPEHPEAVRVIKIDGRIVSMIGGVIRDMSILGCVVRCGSIGSVCTHPDLRGRGLATRLQQATVEWFDREGVDIVFVSGGRGLYRRAGFGDVGQFFRYLVPATTGSTTAAVGPVTEGALVAMAEIHDSEPVRYIRPMADLTVLWKTGAIRDQPGKILLVKESGKPVAYAGIQIAPRSTDDGKKVLAVQEFGGSRQALFDSTGRIAASFGATHVEFPVSWHDAAFLDILRASGLHGTPSSWPGTCGVLSAGRLWMKLRSRLEARAGKGMTDRVEVVDLAGGGAKLSLGPDCLELPAREQVSKFFLSFPDGTQRDEQVKRALSAALPIPLPWPGLNFQ